MIRMSEHEEGAIGRRVLVTGGAGYIGSVLVPRLADRGHRVRVLDRRRWDPDAGDPATGIEFVTGDIRDPEAMAEALEGVDGVISAAGPSDHRTAERDPAANWEMSALATETLGRQCVQRGVERVVFASTCAVYDGAAGMHDEDSPVAPQGPYATAKRYGEEALLALTDEGLCPVVLRSGTAYGWSPRMRFDLVVNTFVRDALREERLVLHGGGWMRRPLVDVGDAAEAMIRALEAPAERVRGEIFNVVHANYRIRELATTVAEVLARLGRHVALEEAGAPGPARDYECSGEKLASRLHFAPARSVAEAVEDLLARLDARAVRLYA
jgi:nucleoside-diphosphate-sugar epimerase